MIELSWFLALREQKLKNKWGETWNQGGLNVD
jgi:hypothetical protein